MCSSESTLLLSAAWVVLQSKQSMFQKIFLKKSQFIVISVEKKEIFKRSFQPKSQWNGPFAFSLGKLCSELISPQYNKIPEDVFDQICDIQALILHYLLLIFIYIYFCTRRCLRPNMWHTSLNPTLFVANIYFWVTLRKATIERCTIYT